MLVADNELNGKTYKPEVFLKNAYYVIATHTIKSCDRP